MTRVALALVVAPVLALGACAKRPTERPEVLGTLTIDGKAVTPLQCRPGAAVHIFVDVVTPAGTLRFEDGKLAYNGEVLTCAKLDRSWGGGRRPNNAAYWRGTLAFRCARDAGTIEGELDLDCGKITPAERAHLDAQRAKARAGAGSAD